MKKEYQKHIVSTPEHQVWLHRASRDSLDKKLKEGLPVSQSGDLTGTASVQPTELEVAEAVYRNGNGYGGIAIVIKLDRELVDTLKKEGKRPYDYAKDKRVGYWHPQDRAYTIQRKYIHGWIDRDTNEYHPNPYRDQPQRLTAKHFPSSMYGGLEDASESPMWKEMGKRVTGAVGGKLKNFANGLWTKLFTKKGELPPPPKGTITVP